MAGLIKTKGYPSKFWGAETFVLDQYTVIHLRSKDIDQIGIKIVDYGLIKDFVVFASTNAAHFFHTVSLIVCTNFS